MNTTDTGWESRFDETWHRVWDAFWERKDSPMPAGEIKDFIRREIQGERRKTVEFIRKNLLWVDQEDERALIFRATVEDLDNLLEAALETPTNQEL